MRFIFCTNFPHRLKWYAECKRSNRLGEKIIPGKWILQSAPPLQDRKRGILMIRTVDIYRSELFLKNINY
ncbi:hypothetical protein T12_603 [Trichinella patagoniensis]|uniref:Uncharacterized protein n=1 Tax=Trichinella patagoniensis TaxID=990121 RepID=A0A0V0ZKU4_9BILA|nr:hypothetical protein T12_603 [Trichinella patagoniensis]